MLMLGLKKLIVLEGVRVSDLIAEDVFSLPVLGEEKIFLNKSERKKELKRDGPSLRVGPLRKPIRDNPKILTKSEKMFLKSEKNISNRNVFWKSSLKSKSNLKNYYKS